MDEAQYLRRVLVVVLILLMANVINAQTPASTNNPNATGKDENPVILAITSCNGKLTDKKIPVVYPCEKIFFHLSSDPASAHVQVIINNRSIANPVHDGKLITVTAPSIFFPKMVKGQVLINGDALQYKPTESPIFTLRLRSKSEIVVLAFFSIIGIIALLYLSLNQLVYRRMPNQGEHVPKNSFPKLLLVEPENQTYSLSRLQFFVWLFILAFAFIYVFLLNAFATGIVAFPDAGSIATFLFASLATLLGAQATSSIKGAKGANQLEPSASDFITHGGVIALEKIQNIVWTVIIAGSFLFAVIRSDQGLVLPDIVDKDLLLLMGISGVGYVTGKAFRKPGPIIKKVTVINDGNHELDIDGENFSKDARLFIDSEAWSFSPVGSILPTDEFVKTMKISDARITDKWAHIEHEIIIINSDEQRAPWKGTPVCNLHLTRPNDATPSVPPPAS